MAQTKRSTRNRKTTKKPTRVPVKRKTTPAGDPIAEVRVSFPSERDARRAEDQIRPTGARIVYMSTDGEDVYL